MRQRENFADADNEMDTVSAMDKDFKSEMNTEMDHELLIDKLTALEESEMQLFRFLKDRPAGAILTADTDIMLAQLLRNAGLAEFDDKTAKALVPASIRDAYRDVWSDELTLRWRKRGWMYKCIEAGKYLYGVMTWDVLQKLFALRYPHAGMDEIRELFEKTPEPLQWFTERNGRLVLNGFERDGYDEYLENEIQKDIPFYIPSKEEVEELYEQGCLISRESHSKLQGFIAEKFDCGTDIAALKIHDLYEMVNNRVRVDDAAEAFAAGKEGGNDFSFKSDEIQFRFVEFFIEMSRECRIRDNRGHDYYEMVGIMALRNADGGSAGGRGSNDSASSGKAGAQKTIVKPAKIGRNEPCPCGSGKKYKNCCGRN